MCSACPNRCHFAVLLRTISVCGTWQKRENRTPMARSRAGCNSRSYPVIMEATYHRCVSTQTFIHGSSCADLSCQQWLIPPLVSWLAPVATEAGTGNTPRRFLFTRSSICYDICYDCFDVFYCCCIFTRMFLPPVPHSLCPQLVPRRKDLYAGSTLHR